MLLLLTKLAQMEIDEMNGVGSKKSTPKTVWNLAEDVMVNQTITNAKKKERKRSRSRG